MNKQFLDHLYGKRSVAMQAIGGIEGDLKSPHEPPCQKCGSESRSGLELLLSSKKQELSLIDEAIAVYLQLHK